MDEMCFKIRKKVSGALFDKTWRFGARRLRLMFRKNQWIILFVYLRFPVDLTAEKIHKIRTCVTMSSVTKNDKKQVFCTQPPEWRVARLSFRAGNILLLFGASRRDFDTPNPYVCAMLAMKQCWCDMRTLFRENGSWFMKKSSDPMNGWFFREILIWIKSKNDFYGKLYFYFKNLFDQLGKRFSKSDVSFHFCHDIECSPCYPS